MIGDGEFRSKIKLFPASVMLSSRLESGNFQARIRQFPPKNSEPVRKSRQRIFCQPNHLATTSARHAAERITTKTGKSRASHSNGKSSYPRSRFAGERLVQDRWFSSAMNKTRLQRQALVRPRANSRLCGQSCPWRMRAEDCRGKMTDLGLIPAQADVCTPRSRPQNSR